MSSTLAVPIPVSKGRMSDKIDTFSAHISPRDLVDIILRYDPRPQYMRTAPPFVRELINAINPRGVATTERRSGHVDYLTSRDVMGAPYAYPSISVGLEEAPTFDASPTEPRIGIMKLNSQGFKAVIDGLGRLGGTLDLEDKQHDKQATPELRERARRIASMLELPVTFYAPAQGHRLTTEDCLQLFGDFNFRVRKVSQAQAMKADQATDPYLRLANAVAQTPAIDQFGGMEKGRMSLGSRSSALVTQSVLYRTVRGAAEGELAQMTNAATIIEPNLRPDSYATEVADITHFFNELSRRMGERWAHRELLHLSANGWQALGVICYDMHHAGLALTPAQEAKVFNELANIDWSRRNKAWVEIGLGTWGEDGQVVFRAAGRSARHAMIEYLRRETGLRALLDAKGAA